ncbi:MAG: acyltransferase [Chloroflexaceae bacterium]
MNNQVWKAYQYTNEPEHTNIQEPSEPLPIQDTVPLTPIMAAPTAPAPSEDITNITEHSAWPGRGYRRLRKLRQALYDEVIEFHPRLELVKLLLAPLPMYVGGRLRARMLRLTGFAIESGTMMWGMPRISGRGNLYRRLKVGRGCMFNIGCVLDLGAEIIIGDRVFFGHEVMILTTTHKIGTALCRCDAPRKLPVTIGAGTWVGARCTILPGVTIGAGAVVAAGAVVNKDVPANTLVAGVPARVVKSLE